MIANIRKGLSQNRRSANLDAVFAALADAMRRSIIESLGHDEARVTELAEPFAMSLNAVSKHIRVLETSGLVRRRKSGRDHFLSINPRSLEDVETWIALVRSFWNRRLDAMERLVQQMEREERKR